MKHDETDPQFDQDYYRLIKADDMPRATIPLGFYDDHIPDDRPGAGELDYDHFADVREEIVEVCQRYGLCGPEDRPWEKVSYWVVDDQYNDERYQCVEITACGMSKKWLLDLMVSLRKFPEWGCKVIGIPHGGLIVFSDRIMVRRGPTLDGCTSIDDVVKQAAVALSLKEQVENCKDDVDLELLSKDPAITNNPLVACKLQLKMLSDAGLPYLAHFPMLTSLVLDQSSVTDQGLAQLRPLLNLEDLWLQCGQIGDDALENLPLLPKLRKLLLGGTRVSNRGLNALLRYRTLEELDLPSTKITDLGLAFVGQLTRLRKLRVAGCRIGDNGLAHLQALRNLETLDLKSTQISDQGLRHFFSHPKLSKVDLSCTGITDKGLEIIFCTRSLNLKEVTLFDTAASNREIEQLRKAWPECHIVSY